MFENFNVQAGSDESGVPTDMLSLNSTVKILYRNPATFFAVHVTSTPLELHYFQLKLASGQVNSYAKSKVKSVILGLNFSGLKFQKLFGHGKASNAIANWAAFYLNACEKDSTLEKCIIVAFLGSVIWVHSTQLGLYHFGFKLLSHLVVADIINYGP